MFSEKIICRFVWICLVGLWLPMVSIAETQGKHYTFDLSTCIQQVLKANPRAEVAKLDVEEADLQFQSAKLSRIPKIELFNRTGIVNDATGDAVTGEDLEGSFGPFNKLDLQLTQPLYTFGRIKHNIEAANINVDRQKASRFKTASKLILDAHKRYYGSVLAQQLLKTTRDIQKNFSDAHEIAQERLDQGDAQVTETDALKLRVGLAVVTKNLYKVQREARMTKEALREIMGLEDRVDFDTAEKRLKLVEFTLQPLDHYLAEAGENNPNIRQLQAVVKAEEARYLAERAKYYPTLLALGGLRYAVAPGREKQHNPFLTDNFNFFDAGIALGLKWDLSFIQTNTEVKQQKVRYLRAKSQLNRVLNGVHLQVKDKYHRYKEKENNLEASFEAKKAGRALLFLNLTNFRLGMGSGKDVFDSLSLHARTDGDYYQAIFEFNMAVVELNDATGKLSPDKYADTDP